MLRLFASKKVLDDTLLEQIEEDLIKADVGVRSTMFVMNRLKKTSFSKEVSIGELKKQIFEILKEDLSPFFVKNSIVIDKKPFVITMVGTNGSGKTTSIAKLSYMLKQGGYKVLLAPCDTFRAGAKEQLNIWAQKLQVDMFEDETKDPSALAYKSLEYATINKYDVLIIDTAGRQENNVDLMNELQKIDKSLKKYFLSAPHQTIFVVDATIGQSAVEQAKSFNKVIDITGIIITKMDSQAKGGVLINIMKNLLAPIYFVGTGESETDYEKFNLDSYLLSLVNKEPHHSGFKLNLDANYNAVKDSLNLDIQKKQENLANTLKKHKKEVEDLLSSTYDDNDLDSFIKKLDKNELNDILNEYKDDSLYNKDDAIKAMKDNNQSNIANLSNVNIAQSQPQEYQQSQDDNQQDNNQKSQLIQQANKEKSLFGFFKSKK